MTSLRTTAICVSLLLLLPAAMGAEENVSPIAPPKLTIEQRVAFLESQLEGLQARAAQTRAFISCEEKGFVVLQLETIPLVVMVSCDNVEPYLEGYKITLNVLNPHSVRLSNISGKLGYGKGMFSALTQSVPISSAQYLAPGSWTPISVVVSPAKAEDLRSLNVTMTIKTVGAN